MKKIVLFLATCYLMCVSSVHAQPGATSALTESILEYEAILDALGTNPTFEDVIGPDEFIVDIDRKTDRLNVIGEIKYLIKTCTINDNDRCRKKNKYLVILDVQSNPAIGPRIITVEEIKKISHSPQKCGRCNR